MHTISTCPQCGQEMRPTDYHARLRAINADLLAALIALSNSCDTGKRGITESTKAPSLIELRAARATIAKATS